MRGPGVIVFDDDYDEFLNSSDIYLDGPWVHYEFKEGVWVSILAADVGRIEWTDTPRSARP